MYKYLYDITCVMLSFTSTSTVTISAGGLRMEIWVIGKVDAGFGSPPLDFIL